MFELYYRILSVFQHTYTGRIIVAMIELMILVGPFFLISIVINAALKTYVLEKKWITFSGNETLAVIAGACLGIISPLPTYLAVPLAISLLPAGVPISALAAFAVSSPLINPGIFILTWSQLGAGIAIARVVSAFALAIIAGMLAKVFWDKKAWPVNADNTMSSAKRPVLYEVKRSTIFLGRYFLISIFLAALVKALVPAELIARMLGGQAKVGLIMAIALGVPFYSCGGAAIPLVRTLADMGMSHGAVLAFFIAGPATKLETLYVYKSLLGIKIFIAYLVLTLIGAFLSGLVLMQFM
jgi:uncharacterized protein